MEGFDCSGFVWFVLTEAGVVVPAELRHANEFFDSFGVSLHREHLHPGDLIFYSWTGVFPQHMGLVLARGRYIHAHQRDGIVKISTLGQEKPVPHPSPQAIYARNPIGFKRITTLAGRWRYPIGEPDPMART